MAEPQESRQEQEARWAAKRAARSEVFHAGQRRRQKNRRIWATVGATVLIAAVVAGVVLL